MSSRLFILGLSSVNFFFQFSFRIILGKRSSFFKSEWVSDKSKEVKKSFYNKMSCRHVWCWGKNRTSDGGKKNSWNSCARPYCFGGIGFWLKSALFGEARVALYSTNICEIFRFSDRFLYTWDDLSRFFFSSERRCLRRSIVSRPSRIQGDLFFFLPPILPRFTQYPAQKSGLLRLALPVSVADTRNTGKSCFTPLFYLLVRRYLVNNIIRVKNIILVVPWYNMLWWDYK